MNNNMNLIEEINVVIEIPAFSDPIKYELSENKNNLIVDRFLPTFLRYPINYGFLPYTLSEDGDPLDILVISPFPIQHKAFIKCRPIGSLNMEDEAGIDVKILTVPINTITPLYSKINEYIDLDIHFLKEIEYFFLHYKDLEKNKWVKIDGWNNRLTTNNIILNAINNYKINNINI
jgi:inorganic pyrophosphatase